jgi:magnesium-transporting ATPase (P-type)
LRVDDVLLRLPSSSGLASEQAAEFLELYASNEVVKRENKAAIVRFFLSLRSPLVMILLFAGVISGITVEPVNSARAPDYNSLELARKFKSY